MKTEERIRKFMKELAGRSEFHMNRAKILSTSTDFEELLQAQFSVIRSERYAGAIIGLEWVLDDNDE